MSSIIFRLDIVLYLFLREVMEDYRTQFWSMALERNRSALARIVAEIVALLGAVTGGRLSPALYAKVERVLRPTESALRRLIVIAARGLVVTLAPKRVMPKGLKIERNPSSPMAFRLFDARKSFDFAPPENPLFVKVQTYSSNPFNLFQHYARIYPAQQPKQEDTVDAAQLTRRLAAVKAALENLPRQALRMARWQMRRKTMEKPQYTSPLRLGPAPGQRLKPKLEIDFILQECQGLAWDSLRVDSS